MATAVGGQFHSGMGDGDLRDNCPRSHLCQCPDSLGINRAVAGESSLEAVCDWINAGGGGLFVGECGDRSGGAVAWFRVVGAGLFGCECAAVFGLSGAGLPDDRR